MDHPLRAYIKNHGESVRAFSKRIGYSFPHVYCIIGCRRPPSWAFVVACNKITDGHVTPMGFLRVEFAQEANGRECPSEADSALDIAA